ncbi:MAG: hypothetical protein IJJ15_08835 [Ruminococcus sp.]|nr:hypothetical protein [Ruminococcus sp.]
MTIKKWNARLSLLTILLLLIHEGYQLFAYITFYYNPTLSKVSGYAVAGCFVLHGILSAISVFFLHDAKSIAYKRLNIKTVLQRVSAALIILLLPIHIFSFSLLQSSVGGIGYWMVETAQILYYAALSCHIALSFGNALISLGWLSDIRKKRVIDMIVLVICALLFIAVSVIITTTHTKIIG